MIRDTRVLYLALGIPVIMLIIFGYGVSSDVDHVPLAVVDQDATRASRRLAEAMTAGNVFVRESNPRSAEKAEALFRRGHIKAVLVIPKGYARQQLRNEPSSAQLLVDGSDSTTASVALGYAAGIFRSATAVGPKPVRASLTEGPAIRSRFNPAMRSSYNIVPAVIAMILAMVMALLPALTVAREWERGSMEQLFATPVGRGAIIIGKLIPYAGLGFVQTLLVLTLGSCMFDVPIVGSLAMLFGCSMLFLLAMIGIGLFVSVATKSQMVSVQFALLISMLPAMLLSGFLYPVENMAFVLRGISAVVPARYYIATLRGVLLKGNGLGELWSSVLALAGFSTAVVTLAVVRFRRRLG
jgi:ABC-2 type transport system permease protein